MQAIDRTEFVVCLKTLGMKVRTPPPKMNTQAYPVGHDLTRIDSTR